MKPVFNTICLFLFCLFWVGAEAQDAEWSNPEKFRTRTAYTKVLGQNEQGIFVFRSKSRSFSRKVYLQLYRENMGMVYSKLMPGLKKSNFENAFVYPDGLRLFKSRYNHKTNRIELFAQKYNSEADPVGEEQSVTTAPQRDYSDEGDYVVLPSADLSKIMCFHTEVTDEKKTIVEIVVLDGNSLTEISRKKQELPYGYNDFTPLEFAMANNGNAYFIFRIEDEDVKKSDFGRFKYFLYAYNGNNGDLGKFYLNTENTYLGRPYLAIDYFSNKVIAGAFYSLEEAGYSKGVLDFGLDMQTHDVLYNSLLPYPFDFVADVLGRSAAQQGEELKDFYPLKVVPRSDSGYILLAEEFYTSTQTYTFTVNGMMQIGSRELYNYGKVAVLSVTKSGEVEWGKVINKNQTSSLDLGYYSSIFTVAQKNKLHIYFNDENRGNSEITLFTLDNSGKLDSRLLFKNQSSNISVVPREAKQLDAQTVLFPASKDRKFALLKLSLN